MRSRIFLLPVLFVAVFAGPVPIFADHAVNINTADLALLDTVPEIGPAIAQRIIDYRTAHGPFSKIEDIQKVTGIGSGVTYDKIKGHITVGVVESQPPAQTEATSSTQTQTQVQTQTQSAPVPSYVAPPVPEVFADAGDNRTVIVGADVVFDGRAYNRQKEILGNTRFLWNFGDGATAEGPTVLHHFEYPGRYAVVLTIAENKSAAADQVVVLAEPANLAFYNLPDGGVRIENRAGRDLDLSRWIVRQFGRDFPLPEHSTVLAGSSMFVAQKTLGFWSGPSAELDYPNGTTAVHAGESASSTSITAAAGTVLPAVETPPVLVTPKAPAKEDELGEVLGATTSAPAPITDKASSSLWLSLGALTVLLAGGAGSVHYLGLSAKRPETPLSADEFDIE